MSTKRGRGRPKGSTIKGDARHLDAVADLMVRDPDLKKTPAISKITQKAFPQQKWEAVERRLLRKWNETATDRIEAAKERLTEERQRPSGALTGVFGDLAAGRNTGFFGDLTASISLAKQMQDIVDPPSLRFMRKHIEEAQRMRDMLDPPFMRQIREQSELIKKAFGHL